MISYHTISSEFISLKTLSTIILERKHLKLSETAKQKIKTCRSYLDEKLEASNTPVYGINTGFGSLCNVKISKNELSSLQENLVMSHACGTGGEVPQDIVRLMLLLKIQSLSYGHSGVAIKTVERLIDFYNEDVLPIIYTQGSLGASGDLAPLAHLALPLIGKGQVNYKGKVLEGDSLVKRFSWEPIVLKSKEGLALLNGTQFMSAFGVSNLLKSYKLSYLADVISSISFEAFNCRMEPFNELIHSIRPHEGQLKTASRFSEFLKDSSFVNQPKINVQDPYSFRCIPQVHGATKDTLVHVEKILITEINSVTDNPLLFPEEDEIISGGNFHGQPLALALDFLKIAMAELGSISERRIYKLISGERGLPEFLVNNPGVNSGFMITQYTAASIVSANKQLATPASVDSIMSSNGQEDHVSMGANAAKQAYDLVSNVERIIAIELLNASQAFHFRKPLKSSVFIESFLAAFRKNCPFIENDIVFYKYIDKSILFLNTIEVDLSRG